MEGVHPVEIRISDKGMLKVLKGSGIEETDAKAIVLDLLMHGETERTEPQQRPQPSQPPRPPETRINLVKSVESRKQRQEVFEEAEAEAGEDPEPEPAHQPLQRTTIKRAKRLSFTEFGGPSEPLT